MDARYHIDTPENIAFSYDIAGIGTRFLAAIVDTIIVGLGMIGVLAAEGFLSRFVPGGSGILLAIAYLLVFILQWGYYTLFETFWNGATPGKKMIRLRVVREGGRPVTFASATIRNIMRAVDFLPFFYGVGVLAMFIDRRSRRLGDLAAGTFVVKEQTAISLEQLAAPSENVPPVSPAEVAAFNPIIPNLQLVSTQDYQLVQEFLQRRRELNRESRTALGRQLAEGIGRRLALPPIENPEQFLEYLVHEYRMVQAKQQLPASVLAPEKTEAPYVPGLDARPIAVPATTTEPLPDVALSDTPAASGPLPPSGENPSSSSFGTVPPLS